MQVAPLRRIISLVITNTAAAEWPTVLCSLVTEVTGMSIEGHDDGRFGELLDGKVEESGQVGGLAFLLGSRSLRRRRDCLSVGGGFPHGHQ